MNALDLILHRQVRWAELRGLHPDAKGYLPMVAENLFAPLSSATESEFRRAAGSELTDRPGDAAKMRALHSSSALVCNVFEYWRNDLAALARALDISTSITRLQFEAQLPTGLRGTAPTLDLLLVASDDLAWGVESKFTEPFQGSKDRPLFAESYFDLDVGLWAGRGLPKCQDIAQRLNEGRTRFIHIDAAQLLKHALGVRRRYRDGKLLLLWYEVDAPDARAFADEIQVFTHSIDEELGFRAVTHQEVFEHLSSEPAAAPAYVDYVRSRYFAV